MSKSVPISEKYLLTLEEAAAYFNVGEKKLRELTDGENCPYVLFCGSKRLIKRVKFQNYLCVDATLSVTIPESVGFVMSDISLRLADGAEPMLTTVNDWWSGAPLASVTVGEDGTCSSTYSLADLEQGGRGSNTGTWPTAPVTPIWKWANFSKKY